MNTPTKKFKRIYIEITNICNLSCSFCPIEEREKGFVEVAQFAEVLKEVSPLTEQVCLHLMGEPLAHPQFSQVLKACSKYDTKIQLTTNGLLLKKHSRLILDSDCVRQVNVSVQSYMDNFPDKDIHFYLDQIYEFISDAQKHRPDLYLNIRLWNIDDTDTDTDTEKNEIIFRYFENKFNTKINRRLELGKIKSKKVVDKLYFHFDSRFEWPRLEQPFQSKNGRCNGLIDHFAIHADGTVVPCCLDDQKIINLGNVFNIPVADIINSTRALNISQGFKSNQLCEELCQKCTYINRFK